MSFRRHTTISVTLVLACAALASCAREGNTETGSSDAVGDSGSDRGSVESVTDGDTIRLEDGRRVRLVQIDAPEVGDRAQCWGDEATEALESRLRRGSKVTLTGDPDLDDVDKHGRELRYVEADGELLNRWLVLKGHAAPYFFRSEQGAHAEELLAAARDARRARRGMWGACPDVELDPAQGL